MWIPVRQTAILLTIEGVPPINTPLPKNLIIKNLIRIRTGKPLSLKNSDYRLQIMRVKIKYTRGT